MAGSKKGPIYAAMAANMGIAIAKFIAAGITSSSAMLSEGIHSLVDTGNGFLLLFGIRQSKKKPDPDHPFGFGKEIYFWSLIVAILIFALGGGMSFYEGIQHVKHPPEALKDPTISYIVLFVSIIFEGAALIFALKSFNKTRRGKSFWTAIRQSKDPSSFAVIFEDAAALLGLLIALAGVFFAHTLNMPILDGAASIAIGVLLSLIAVVLAYESKALLIGESVDPEVRQNIKRLLDEDPAVFQSQSPATMHLGPDDVLLALDVEFKDNLSSDEIEEVVARLEDKIKVAHPEIKRIYIEAKSLHLG